MDTSRNTAASGYHFYLGKLLLNFLSRGMLNLEIKILNLEIKKLNLGRGMLNWHESPIAYLNLSALYMAGAARNACQRVQSTGGVRFLTSSGPRKVPWLRWKPCPSSTR